MLSTAFEYVAANTKGVPAERVVQVREIKIGSSAAGWGRENAR
jgi:hypothetical protein